MKPQWFYMVLGEEVGPITAGTLKTLADRGTISLDTPVRTEGSGWIAAEKVEGLFCVAPLPATESRGNAATVCPYCREEIRSDARKCKHCGEWLRGARRDKHACQEQPTLIELTSKKWKARMVLGGVVAGLCFAAATIAGPRSVSLAIALLVICLVALVYSLWAKVGAWWEHG
jgi:hypothetical protein